MCTQSCTQLLSTALRVPFVRPQLQRERRDVERDSPQQMAELCSAEVRNNPLGWPQITGCLLFSAQPWVHLYGLGLSPWQDRRSVIKLLLWCHFSANRSSCVVFLCYLWQHGEHVDLAIASELFFSPFRAFCAAASGLVCHVSLDWRPSLTGSSFCCRTETSPTLLSSLHFHLHFQRVPI